MERVKLTFKFWSILGLMAMILIWFLPWRFQVNDDVIMMWLVSGAYTGEPESYAVFIHPLLSWFFSILYTNIPEFNWYGAFWFSVIYFSYLLITYSIQKTAFSKFEKVVFTLFFLILCLHLCYFLQFTLVAGISGLAGLLFLFSQKNNNSLAIYIFGLLAILVSILVRWESFALIAIGFSLYQCVFFSPSLLKEKFLTFLLIGLIFLSGVFSKIFFERNSEYADYLSFNKARSSVIDHPVFYYMVKSDQIKPDSDWFYFSRWMFEEGNVSEETLKVKEEELNKARWNMNFFSSTMQRFWTIQKTELFKSMCILFLSLLYFLYLKKSRKGILFFLIWGLFFLFFNFYFLILGRVILLFFLVLFIPIISQGKEGSFKKFEKLSIAILLLFFIIHSNNFYKEAKDRKLMNSELNSLLANIPAKEPLFIEGFFEYNFMDVYNWKKPTPNISLGWLSRSPFQKKAMKRFGINSLATMNSYYFIGINIPEPLVLADYINSLADDFHEKTISKTPIFTLQFYIKEREGINSDAIKADN